VQVGLDRGQDDVEDRDVHQVHERGQQDHHQADRADTPGHGHRHLAPSVDFDA